MKHLIAQFRDNAPGKITRDQIKAWSLHPPSEITRFNIGAPVWTGRGTGENNNVVMNNSIRLFVRWLALTSLSVLQTSPDTQMNQSFVFP